MFYRIIFGLILASGLMGCPSSQYLQSQNDEGANDRWDWESSLPLNGSGYHMTEAGADFYRSQTELSNEGLVKLPQFLKKTHLSFLRSLRELGGTDEASIQLCHQLYAYYNSHAEEKLSDERCTYNQEGDGFADYGNPLAFILQQFDHYLLLYVGEEGLGAPIFYFYSYNLETGEITSIDLDFVNSYFGKIAYENGMLNFFYYDSSLCDEHGECPIVREAMVDLNTGTLTSFSSASSSSSSSSIPHQTYRNDTLGFTIEMPKDWHLPPMDDGDPHFYETKICAEQHDITCAAFEIQNHDVELTEGPVAVFQSAASQGLHPQMRSDIIPDAIIVKTDPQGGAEGWLFEYHVFFPTIQRRFLIFSNDKTLESSILPSLQLIE